MHHGQGLARKYLGICHRFGVGRFPLAELFPVPRHAGAALFARRASVRWIDPFGAPPGDGSTTRLGEGLVEVTLIGLAQVSVLSPARR